MDKEEILNLKNKSNFFEKQVKRNFEHLKQKFDAHNRFQNLITTRDEQKFKYTLDFYDSILSLTKTVFVVTLSGFLTSLSLINVDFLDVSYLRLTLIRTVFASLVIGIIIYIRRHYVIKKIIEIINARSTALWDLFKAEDKTIDNLHKDKERMNEINQQLIEIERKIIENNKKRDDKIDFLNTFKNFSIEKSEVHESQDGGVHFYFTHSDKDFTKGLMIIRPHYELPKHNRPFAVENLIQISGECVMKLFSDEINYTEHILKQGDDLQIPIGQYHIHANTKNIESVTLFMADGDITAVMDVIRKDYKLIK